MVTEDLIVVRHAGTVSTATLCRRDAAGWAAAPRAASIARSEQ